MENEIGQLFLTCPECENDCDKCTCGVAKKGEDKCN